MAEMCVCGQPLPDTDPSVRAAIERLIFRFGPTIVVTTPAGSWRVPRHYIALHGLIGAELPWVARRFNFEEVGRA